MYHWSDLLSSRDIVMRQWYFAAEFVQTSETLIYYLIYIHNNSEMVAILTILGFIAMFSLLPVIFVLRLQKVYTDDQKLKDEITICPPAKITNPQLLTIGSPGSRMSVWNDLRPSNIIITHDSYNNINNNDQYYDTGAAHPLYDLVLADTPPDSHAGTPHDRLSPVTPVGRKLRPAGESTPEARLQRVYRRLDGMRTAIDSISTDTLQ